MAHATQPRPQNQKYQRVGGQARPGGGFGRAPLSGDRQEPRMLTRSSSPTSLTRRFALAAAGLAAGALLLTALASWWLLTRQHEDAMNELGARERQFHAQTIGLNLTALSTRMTEIAGSTILATGLVDSAGRETYLQPFLAGIRQVNGIPVQVLFTDFEGREIASNNAKFNDEQRLWLKEKLQLGRPASAIFLSGESHELVALAPLVYPRTKTPEGGLLYKVSLNTLHSDEHIKLLWGPPLNDEMMQTSPVVVPALFGALDFRIQGISPLDSNRSLSPLYLPIFLLVLGLFIAVVVGGAHMASVLTRDLRKLQLFASHLVRDGLSQERAQTTDTEEVASLSTSINQMLERLYEQRQALTREAQKQVDLAEALKLADKRKDEFVAMLAHELRNPLAPIMTGAEMLKLAAQDDPLIQRTGLIISNQAKHMARIIDDLLDVSRITRGQVTLKLETIDFATVVAVAIEQIRPLIESSQHHFSVSIPPGPLPVRGDHARLVQVTSNLLNNAAKYTPDHGYLNLRVAIEGGELRMTVGDNGSGIDPDLMPEIFDLFTQGERSSGRRQGGLGLGLALVKSLVQMHGGRVTADSPGYGKGSSFNVYLPCASLEDLPPAKEVASPSASGRALKLHLVDDNVDAAQTLAILLQMDGFQVAISFDGLSTLAKVKESKDSPAIFILDIGLPDMDGTELAQKLREMPHLQNTKMVALTGYGQASDKARSLAAGFDYHLVKPVDYENLKALLSEIQEDLKALV
jgi:signal transduction histidine kinase/CheY-like chemotaxis protein